MRVGRGPRASCRDATALALLLAQGPAGCSEDLEPTSPALASAAPTGATTGDDPLARARPPALGAPAECQVDTDCAPHEACFDDPGVCACRPGFVLCGTDCVDLASDTAHCGQCSHECTTGAPCVKGRCDRFPSPGMVCEPPTLVSGADPWTTCVYANEATPERPINWFLQGPAYFAAIQATLDHEPTTGYHAAADANHQWTLGQTPLAAPDIDVIGDPASTTHGGTGLEYVAFLARSSRDMGECVVAAATSADLISSNDWLAPLRCVQKASLDERSDGPSIHADLGDEALYISYNDVPVMGGRKAVLLRFGPCEGAVVGDPGDCPLDWKRQPFTLANLRDHASVVVNPCTHHPILLARSTTSGAVLYVVYDLHGNEVVSAVADTSAPFQNNTPCAGLSGQIETCGLSTEDCGDGVECLDLAFRVHAATRHDPATGRCTMALAYDRSAPASDGATYMKTRLRILDITDELDVTEVATLDSAPLSAPANDFNAMVTIDQITGAQGMFFYHQRSGDPCTTTIRGIVSPDGEEFTRTPDLTEPFPSIYFDFTHGMGHYVEASRFNEPGWLLPTWSQPVQLEHPKVACTPCQGHEYSLATMGARVKP